MGPVVGGLSRRLGAGGGGVIGGRVTLALDPVALAHLSTGLRSALVSGTNGKTTTTRMLAAALGTIGPVTTNAGGANLPYGLVAALSSGAWRRPRREGVDGSSGGPGLAALEVDESYVGIVAEQVHPAVVVLLNLSRDQLDRSSEVRLLSTRWRRATAQLGADATVVANADDPMVVWGAGEARRVVWVAAGLVWRNDAVGCPNCEGRIEFHPGGWACSCGFRRPDPDVTIEDDQVVTRSGARFGLELGLPGRCNRANAAMALTGAEVMGADPGPALHALAGLSDVDGRYATVTVGGNRARLLLAKNPAGWAEVFDVLAPEPGPVVVAINAKVADGRDPSWLWDVPFERLAGRRVVATGERCLDLAVRLRYAGVEHKTVRDLVDAVSAAGRVGPDNTPVDVVANYTTFQALRRRAA